MCSFYKHISTDLTKDIWTAQICTEVFAIPEHFMHKLSIKRMSTPRAIAIYNNAELMRLNFISYLMGCTVCSKKS